MANDINRDFERVSPEVVRQASEFQAAILADVNGRSAAPCTAASPRCARA
jgi:4-hydroxy-4-methyl-2-oxoglutarate aldolase